MMQRNAVIRTVILTLFALSMTVNLAFASDDAAAFVSELHAIEDDHVKKSSRPRRIRHGRRQALALQGEEATTLESPQEEEEQPENETAGHRTTTSSILSFTSNLFSGRISDSNAISTTEEEPEQQPEQESITMPPPRQEHEVGARLRGSTGAVPAPAEQLDSSSILNALRVPEEMNTQVEEPQPSLEEQLRQKDEQPPQDLVGEELVPKREYELGARLRTPPVPTSPESPDEDVAASSSMTTGDLFT